MPTWMFGVMVYAMSGPFLSWRKKYPQGEGFGRIPRHPEFFSGIFVVEHSESDNRITGFHARAPQEGGRRDRRDNGDEKNGWKEAYLQELNVRGYFGR